MLSTPSTTPTTPEEPPAEVSPHQLKILYGVGQIAASACGRHGMHDDNFWMNNQTVPEVGTVTFENKVTPERRVYLKIAPQTPSTGEKSVWYVISHTPDSNNYSIETTNPSAPPLSEETAQTILDFFRPIIEKQWKSLLETTPIGLGDRYDDDIAVLKARIHAYNPYGVSRLTEAQLLYEPTKPSSTLPKWQTVKTVYEAIEFFYKLFPAQDWIENPGYEILKERLLRLSEGHSQSQSLSDQEKELIASEMFILLHRAQIAKQRKSQGRTRFR